MFKDCKKAIQRLLRAAALKFPNAVVHIPKIDYHKGLLKHQVKNLQMINRCIEETGYSIPLLPWGLFETEDDKISWEPQTAIAMCTHWMRHLKLGINDSTDKDTVGGTSVLNLSRTFQLSSAALAVLDKGLTFIPSHLVKSIERKRVLADLGQFFLKMKRAVFFGPDVGLGQAKPFCTRSSWTPPPQHLPAELWDFFEKCGEDVGEVVKGIRGLNTLRRG